MIDALSDWTLCRSFLAVLREGSLTGAARVLHVAHPTIRRHLDALEGALRTPLFVRSPSGLTPTELAETLRDPAEAMESAFEQLVRAASGAGQAIDGTVRITASEVVGVEVLPPLLAALKKTHPGLVFELDLTDSVADVLRRDADIAVRMVRPVQADLVARRVASVGLGLFAHRDWVEAHGSPKSAKALMQSGAMIGYDRSTALIDALRDQGVAAERRQFQFRSDSTVAHLAAMRAGLGVAICQKPIALRDPSLAQVLPKITGKLDIWLVSHPNLRGIKRIGVCMEHLARGLTRYAKCQ